MVLDVPPTMYFAQVYDCSTYGAAAYNECPETSDTTTGGSTSPSLSTNNANNIPTAPGEPTTPETPQAPSPTQPTTTEESKDIELITPAKTIAAMDWLTFLPLALILSVLVAIIILLFKRRRRRPTPQF